MSKAVFIGKVAQAGGASVQAVRDYEWLGLLPAAQRTESGYRVYSPEVIERLKFIQQAQALRFRLEEIREILRMKYAGNSPCDCVRRLLEEKLDQIEREMARLREFRRELHKTLNRSKHLSSAASQGQWHLPHHPNPAIPAEENREALTNENKKGGQKPCVPVHRVPAVQTGTIS